MSQVGHMSLCLKLVLCRSSQADTRVTHLKLALHVSLSQSSHVSLFLKLVMSLSLAGHVALLQTSLLVHGG